MTDARASTAPPPAVVETEAEEQSPGPREEPRVILPALDGFRGLAAVTVVAYHCFLGAGLPRLDDGLLRSLLAASYMGVDFFFVISGFVLFLPVALAGGNFGNRKSFLIRRLARIVPAFYAFLFLVIGLNRFVAIGVELPYDSLKGFLSLFAHLSFLHHQLGHWLGGAGFGVLTVSWTLTLEMAFYLLLPFVAPRFYRHPFAWLAGAFVVSSAWKLAATHTGSSLGWMGAGSWSDTDRFVRELILVTQLPTFVTHFALGMVAAWLFVRCRRNPSLIQRWQRWIPIVQIAALASVLIGMRAEGIRQLSGGGSPLDAWTRTTPVAIAFAVLVLGTVLGPRWSQLPMANRMSRRLGDISYGIYLSHLAFVGFALVTLNWLPDASVWAFVRMALLVVPGSFLAGWLSAVIIEAPARRWARRRTTGETCTDRRGSSTMTPCPSTGGWAGPEERSSSLQP